MVPDSGAASGRVGRSSSGAIEIKFAAGARMRITDAVTLKAAVAALADGRPR
jgi:transposase